MTNLKCFINTALETKIDLSNQNLKTIEEKAFAGDAFIEVVQLPDTINEIQTGSFENCTKLKSIVIGSIPESQKNEEETVIFTKYQYLTIKVYLKNQRKKRRKLK